MKRIKPKKRPVRKDADTRPVRGSPSSLVSSEQKENNFYHCWNCNFTCKEGRDYLGGPDEDATIALSEVQLAPGFEAEDVNSTLTPDSLIVGGEYLTYANWPTVTTFIGVSTNPKDVVHHELYPMYKVGCPLCGSINWKGKY